MVMLDQHVKKELNNAELLQVAGGVSISGTLINAFTSAFKAVYNMGKDFGRSLRSAIKRKICN